MKKRSKISCKHKHTPSALAKQISRAAFTFRHLKKNQDIFTISPGAILVATLYSIFTGWAGNLVICDQDTFTMRVAKAMARDVKRIASNFGVTLQFNIVCAPEPDLVDALAWYLSEFGSKRLGVVDLDLTESLYFIWNSYGKRCSEMLLNAGAECWVYIISALRNRPKNSPKGYLKSKESWLGRRAQAGVTVERSSVYRSDTYSERLTWRQGSCMLITELKVSSKAAKKNAPKRTSKKRASLRMAA